MWRAAGRGFVLVVEDNRVHREIACTVLEKHGFGVVQARDGQEALARLPQEPFLLVLMDIDMPWMSGIAAAERLRAMKRRGQVADIPIVAFTADHSADTQARCLAAGMVDVIPKHIWMPKWEQAIFGRLAPWLHAD